MINLDAEMDWIDWFVQVEPTDNREGKKIPPGMVSPFSK